jgi:SulP family sulfate permease
MRRSELESAGIQVPVLATVVTHNLAIGVGVGVLTAMVLFAQRVSRLARVERTVTGDALWTRLDGSTTP